MRKKTLKPVVTFATTSDAMAMEASARKYGLPGRMIPVPTEIDAGCGLSWCAEMSERDELLAGLETYAIPHEGVFDVMLY